MARPDTDAGYRAATQGTGTNRHVIMAYTIAQDGIYSITNSLMDIVTAQVSNRLSAKQRWSAHSTV